MKPRALPRWPQGPGRRSLAPTLSFLLLVACGSRDEGQAPSPQPMPRTVATPVTDPASFPLAVLTRTLENGQKSRCMGSHLGSGAILTAGHCLEGLGPEACANGSFTVTWARDSQGTPESPRSETSACSSFLVADSASHLDLGIVILPSSSSRPEAAFSFATSAPAKGVRVFAWGPPDEQGFLIAFGTIFAVADTLTHTAPVDGGYSGTPLFGIPASTPATATQGETALAGMAQGILGVHLGWQGGVLAAIPAQKAKEWFESQLPGLSPR